ncbi:MAG: EscU/YscU/HrcU family type III secretion system export apparatus switch protein [Clostridiales bacterium]|jgi:flagellar biosynthesis protein|nr:EscU/YscU/HrcU family type III secretion system export apparatus switch protein [Clostridiales bacterium]
MDKSTNKNKIDINKKAIAISYDIKDPAPKVVAKGQGYVAAKILEKAKEADIPVYKDESLIKDFEGVNLGDNIPPELYEAVARILVFVTDLDKTYDKYGR